MSTRRWRGDAPDVAQVDTITPGGTIGTETFTCTINGKSVTYTAQDGDAVADVVAGLVAAWNASQIPEFAEITATDSTTHMTLTGDIEGVPFTVTSSASGSATNQQATATAATGKHHFDEADNWTGGAVPIDSDTVVFDSGDVDCKYGLSNSGITPASIIITQGFTGDIGLPETNVTDPTNSYREYRTTSLALCDSGDGVNTSITIGEGEGIGSGRIKLNLNDGQFTAVVLNSGQPAEDGVPSILIGGGSHSSNELNVMKGSVGVAFFDGESVTLATLRVGRLDNVIGDATVQCGDGLSLTTLDQTGGTLTADGAATTVNMDDGIAHWRSGNITTLTIERGTLYYKGTGTITTANVGSDGGLDFRRDQRARTVTNLNLYEGSAYHDPFDTVTLTNGADFVHCSPDDVTFDVAPHKTWTPSSI